MENLRILEVMGEGIAHGGEEAFINNLITHIDMEGLTIDWLTPYKCYNTVFESNLNNIGGKVYELGLSYSPGKNRWHLTKPLNQFFAEHQYDVVHIHSGSTSAMTIIAGAAHRHGVKKIIVHSHTGGNNSFKSKAVKAAYSPYMHMYPTDYMACSVNAAEAKFPKSVNETKTKIINNGIELARYCYNPDTRKKIRTEMNIPYDSYVVGHVGRFSPEKNHKFILQCFARVLKRNSNCYLLLVGDGELQEEIKQMAADLSVEEKVRFAGYVSNVPEYYSAMNVFVLPSFFEGFAIAAVEAQATGIPCVLSDRISNETVINKNVLMLPIEEGSSDKWAEVICEHLEDEPIIDQSLLLKRGFDINETVRQIREIYLRK